MRDRTKTLITLVKQDCNMFPMILERQIIFSRISFWETWEWKLLEYRSIQFCLKRIKVQIFYFFLWWYKIVEQVRSVDTCLRIQSLHYVWFSYEARRGGVGEKSQKRGTFGFFKTILKNLLGLKNSERLNFKNYKFSICNQFVILFLL